MTIEPLMLEIESLVFASEKALTLTEIKTVLSELHPDELYAEDQLQGYMEAIQQKYDSKFHPFTIKQIGGGYQFLTKVAYHQVIAKLNGDKFMKRLSTAAIETLAIIAYKQPITKSDIEYIRGVNCDYSIQKLLEKELIIISGRNEEAVGKPLLYSTSKSFMDYLGINSIADMPQLKEVVSTEHIIPTNASLALPDADVALVVGTDGQLLEVEQNSAENSENDEQLSAEGNLPDTNDKQTDDNDDADANNEASGENDIKG
jgi:segregation and condensation protein B